MTLWIREATKIFLLSAFLLTAWAASQPSKLKTAISLAVAAEYEEALELFKEELQRDPTDPLLNYYVGMTETRLLQFSSAIRYFETALEYKADFPQVYFWLTKAYLEQDEKEKALSILERGKKRFPLNKDLTDLAETIEEES